MTATREHRSISRVAAVMRGPLAVLLFASGLMSARAAAADIEPEGRDSAAIAAAVGRCQPGDTLRLPAGTFELSESIQMESGVKLLGAGQDKTILVWSGDKPGPFLSVSDCEDVEIAHLTLDGRMRPPARDGIRAGNSRRLFLHHLTIRDLAKGDSPFVHGIIFSGHNPTMERGVTDSRISDCRFENIGVGAEYGGAVRMAWGSVRNRVEQNVVRDTGRGGIFGDHSAELIIRNNRVSGSGGEGLGIEIWGGCPRSLIEDNVVDHWLSVDQGNQTAVRRNVVGTDDGTLKGYGIEIIASDVVVTDNTVRRGASIGLSVSNKPKKNNVFWGYNTVRDCIQWGAQLQGETGGIAHHYFYRCDFQGTVRGDPRARYPDSGHGFRFNGDSRELVFEECSFRDNGGFGVQFGGRNVDRMTFLRCPLARNAMGTTIGLSPDKTIEFTECTVDDQPGLFPPAKAFSSPAPVADFRVPSAIRAGEAAPFQCASTPGTEEIVERLWDFNDGIAETAADPKHTFDRPGSYRVTLVVWDRAGRGARAEKTVEVLPAIERPSAASAENWPGFRGPTGQGISTEKNLPVTWSLSENLAWRVDVPGIGWSSPIVWDGRVFVTSTTPDGDSCHVVCIDVDRGRIVWDKEAFRQTPNRKLAENSHATPTPATDGKLVFAAFNGGRVVAVDYDGNVVWSWKDSQFVSKHGRAVSPILYKNLLIMPFDGNGPADVDNIGFRTAWDGAFVVALDKNTGQEKWRARRGLSRQAHVTPLIVEVQGKPQLISGAGDVVQGFDPDSGQRLWSVQSLGEGVVPSVVCGQGLVFTSSGYGAPTIRAIRPDGRGDVTATHIAWESRANVPMVPSFVYHAGLLFCVKESGVAACLDAGTGQVLWTHRLGGDYGASPVLAEGRLYCLAEDGSTAVIAADREFKSLARNPLEGPCNASPAISRGRIFIRSQSSLFCIRRGGQANP